MAHPVLSGVQITYLFLAINISSSSESPTQTRPHRSGADRRNRGQPHGPPVSRLMMWMCRWSMSRVTRVPAIRSSPANKTSVTWGREAPRPRNTRPSPYPAPCRVGSRDGQFGGNALGRACSLTCRNSRRSHTVRTFEALATSLQAPRTLGRLRMRDRCPIERGTHGNTVWSGTARSTPAARIR